MACMEHVCNDCNKTWFDNKPRGDCTKCGSVDVGHYFDEANDGDPYDEGPDYDDETPWGN